MKVLIYIEPHPIRGTMIHFRDVARRFLPLLQWCGAVDVRLFANDPTLEELGDVTDEVRQRLIYPEPPDAQMIGDHQREWAGAGIRIWRDLMSGSGSVTEDYLGLLSRIWRRFPFDAIVAWGENAAVRRFANERGLTHIGMELGCTRPPFFDSLVMDPFGTNGAALLPRLSAADVRAVVDDKPLSRHEALLGWSETPDCAAIEQRLVPLGDALSQRLFTARKPVAFLPLQLHDDANLLHFSPYETISEVVLDTVPRLAAAGYLTIIKPHPGALHRPGCHAANALARLAIEPWADSVIWLDEQDGTSNPQLLSAADLVVTVNSSVGFEALYFDKTVVVLGDAVYKPQGLFPTLEAALEGSFDRDAYLHDIGCLRRFMLGAYLQPGGMLNDASGFEDRIIQIDALARMHKDDPRALALGIWQAFAPGRHARAIWSALREGPAGTNGFARPAALPAAAEPGAGEGGGDRVALAPWTPVAQRLMRISRCLPEDFAAWLESTGSTADGMRMLVEEGGILDEAEYLELQPDVARAGAKPLRHYVDHGIAQGRRPRRGLPGLRKSEMLARIAEAARMEAAGERPMFHPLPSERQAEREAALATIRSGIKTSEARIVVVAHLYYRDLVADLLARLGTISRPFDLIVTLPDWGTREIERMVLAAYPRAMLYRAANRGRDIGPFLDVLPLLIERGYDALLKVQTKRGYYQAGQLRPELGDQWRAEALDALLGSQQRVEAILAALAEPGRLSMVGPLPHLLRLADYPYHDGGRLAEGMLPDLADAAFFAGTMFWVRPEVLRPLVGEVPLSLTSFAAETGANDGGLAHLVERMFGHAAQVAGRMGTAPSDPAKPINLSGQPLPGTLHARLEESRASYRIAQARLRA